MKSSTSILLSGSLGILSACGGAPGPSASSHHGEETDPISPEGPSTEGERSAGAQDPDTAPAPPSSEAPSGPRTHLPDDAGVLPGDPTVLTLGEIDPMGYGRFVTSSGCAMCHSNHALADAMRDTAGQEIAPYDMWQGSMMANSARDPFWHAMVSAEVHATGSRQAEIEATCMRCHAPMASESARRVLEREPRMADLKESSGVGQLGRDGVACAACHQIQPSPALGGQASFSGGFEIGDRRVIFGPHRSPVTGPMQHHVDYTPVFGPHMTTSAVCATCHTLVTHAFTPEGEELTDKPFVEQSAFLEWENSDFYDRGGRREGGMSCQACHMPTVDEDGVVIETRIARSPPGGDFNIAERKPFGRHVFLGANTVMPRLIRDQRAILNPQGSDEALERTAAQNEARLQRDTASVHLQDVEHADGRLSFAVEVSSSVGHKFPTGYPSRRAWLMVEVFDADGKRLFRSGGHSERGRLVDGLGDVLDVEKSGGGWEPHREVITRDDQVQIYESVMAGLDGRRNILLTRATAYLKDNRILPMGFREDHHNYEVVRPVGVGDDGDFAAGGDLTRYDLDLGGAYAARVEASLIYQGLGARFMVDLFKHDTDEVAAFRAMYAEADVTPVTVSSVAVDVSGPTR